MRFGKLTLILIGVILFITILHFWQWPFFNGKFFLPFRQLFSFISQQTNNNNQQAMSRDELIQENKDLTDQVTNLTMANIKMQLLEEENEKLRKELNFASKVNYQTILANVIGQKSEAGLSWFIIDRGADDGLESGMVAVNDGVVVGKVMKTTAKTAYLLSLFNERTRLAVEIMAPAGKSSKTTKIEGIIEGASGLAVDLKLVPIDKSIENDDLVMTSGLEYNVPRGLFIGALKDVEGKPTDLFFNAMVDVPYKLDNLGMVTIIIPPK
jgi:rod shape-determining protein MreC